MEITGKHSSIPAALTKSRSNSQPASSWQSGQQLLVRIISTTPQNRVTIDIGGKSFSAQANISLQQGQQYLTRVSTKVVANKELITLKIITNDANREIVTRALRTAMPQQAVLTETFNSWTQLLLPNNASAKILPDALLALIRELLGKLPSLSNINSAAALKNVLQHSGLFLESALNSRADQINDDLKALLLKLAAQIQSSIAVTDQNKQTRELLEQLFRQTESALARIQINQLQSLKQDNAPQALLLELPISEKAHLDNFRLLITRDKQSQQGDSHDEEQWQVRLQFKLPGLGLVEASINIKHQQANVTFIAKDPATAVLFDDRLNELRRDLIEHGLNIGQLSSYHGRIEKLESLPESAIISEQA